MYKPDHMSFCLETSQLTYRFTGQETALKDIQLQVPQGSIYGFLGPNGAGKTTTLKLVLGLLKKQQGHITIFGKPFEQHRVAVLQQVGALIESPSLYSHLSARENLQVLQTIYRCPPQRIHEVLQLVGLANTGHKKAGQFSLGMKQRLAIAMTLLHRPALLILDEPTNGLDPNGIIEMRELLKTINREQGITILISSHLLPEIEKLATHIGIIHKGCLLFQGTLEALMHSTKQAPVTITTNNNAQSLQLLQAQGLQAVAENGHLLLQGITPEKIAAINRQLVQAGIDVYGIHTLHQNLEATFMDLINH
jgi:ABC-2 type transport system ATP-binding protein